MRTFQVTGKFFCEGRGFYPAGTNECIFDIPDGSETRLCVQIPTSYLPLHDGELVSISGMLWNRQNSEPMLVANSVTLFEEASDEQTSQLA